MPPGEPVGSNPEKDVDMMNTTKQPPKYEPQFSKTDWFVEPLITFDADTTPLETVYPAVAYWTQMALDLKEEGYPIAEGIDNYKRFDQKTQQKARMLDDFLDQFITKKLYSDEKEFQILRILIAQGTPYLDFREKMSKVDFSLKCTTIWENDAVAYRCNTCAFTPCMSLCEACFLANGHIGHDYTRFFSREGGACDCGNQDVIRETGNCPDHGDESKRPRYDMTDVCLAEYIVTKLLVRLFLDYRGWARRHQRAEERFHQESNDPPIRRSLFDVGDFTEKDAGRAKKLIEFLQECSNYGGPMRQIVSEVLQNKGLYKALTEKTGEHYDESGRVELNLDWRTTHMFKDDRASVLPGKRHNFSLLGSIEATECFSLLDELIFWIDRQLFPQNLVNFGLSLLSEPGYRDAFALRFFSWYPICGKVISELCTSQSDHSRNEDRVSPACSRAVHVTVQMLSSAHLCKELNEKCQLVRTIFDVTRFLICERLVDSDISLKPGNTFKERKRFLDMTTADGRPNWMVMTMANNAAISYHGYWFVMGDIQNVLTHTPLAVDAVFDEACFGGSYMRMMCQMQGMNPMWRIISGDAQPHDQGEEVQRAYTLEFETLAVTLFNIVSAIQQDQNMEAARRFFYHIKKHLVEWFHVLLPVPDEKKRDEIWGEVLRAQAYAISFHIPLHRHISTALTHFTELPGFYDYIQENFLNDEPLLRILLIHPLRIQVARSEIHCNMWVRNGANARMSALIYSQWNVSSAFQTPDIDLIRFCAAHVDKDWFMRALTTSFNLTESVKVERGKYVELDPEARELFGGVNGQSEEVPENKKYVYRRYRQLIQDHAVLIDRTILGYTENMTEDEQQLRQEVFDIMIHEGFSTEMTIDYQIEKPTVQQNQDPRIPIVGEFIRRHLVAAGVPEDQMVDDVEPEYDPSIFDDDDVERTVVIREPDWIDPMFWGMFKVWPLLCPSKRGATSEEHYRSEMVNCMAMGNVPYSRLRASISEKGSRGSELIDKHFERILKEIGDFNTPTECSTHLQQGSYRLKTSIWDSEVCPVFFMMRSSSMKQAREVFAKMQEREKKNAVDKGLPGIEERFWVPFRLISFDPERRHRGIPRIYNLLLSERFLIHCVAVLASEHDTFVKFHDGTMQLAVYLLTLGVKYVQEFRGDQEIRSHMISIFHTPFKLVKERELDFHVTISSFMIRLLTMECKRNDQLIPVFRNVLNGEYDREKVSGGKMIYLARFMSILCTVSPATRELIQEKLEKEERRLNVIQKESPQKIPMDPVKKAAKEAAKRRMEAIMQNSAKKSAQTMKNLMKTEGMSADEVSSVDPSQQNRRMYECPICGEGETPNTVENPFGILAKLTTNFVCEEQIDASFDPIEDLLEYDAFEDDDHNSAQKETRRHYSNKRRLAFQETTPCQELAKVRAPIVGTDPKTCGHTAHIECFNAYRASLYDGRDNHPDTLRQVHCPMCRHPANMIVPISLDKPYLPIRTPPTPMSYSDVYDVMNRLLKKARGPVYEEDEKNVKYDANYSTRKGGGLYELNDGRKYSADSTERHSALEKTTTSTYLVSLAVAMVERASLMRKMGAPERRKHYRSGITEHIMTASVATSKDIDFDVTHSAMINLFAKVTERALTPSRTQSVSPLPAPSSPSPVPGLTPDELAALAVKSPPAAQVVEKIECRLKVPLYVLEPKSTMVRMLSILIDNQSVTKDVQKEMAHNMIRATIGWVSSYTLFCLVLRLGDAKIRILTLGGLRIEGLSDHLQQEAEVIAKSLTYNIEYFNHLTERLASPDEEVR
uniref:E3 ubiquitin-protein ligase n=1 Tax=Caenorhabditis tropicalis TaxID=1561998 RepID=A0A1I7T3R1_9PELO